MRYLKPFLPLAALVLIGGCANYLYVGKLVAPDSSGKARETILYWTKTDPFLGSAKADSAVLRSACGRPVTFTEKESGIVFIGIPGDDKLKDADTTVALGEVCGRFLEHDRLVEIGAGPVKIRIDCEPIEDDFTVAGTYLAARDLAYIFAVTEQKQWSLMGKPFDAPVPQCSE